MAGGEEIMAGSTRLVKKPRFFVRPRPWGRAAPSRVDFVGNVDVAASASFRSTDEGDVNCTRNTGESPILMMACPRLLGGSPAAWFSGWFFPWLI